MKDLDVVGLSVAVVKKGKIIYNQSFGLKDIATNAPLANDHIFRIASISKSFSATAIMQLVEAGKLSLEDLRSYAIENGEPKAISGQQELYELIVNKFI